MKQRKRETDEDFKARIRTYNAAYHALPKVQARRKTPEAKAIERAQTIRRLLKDPARYLFNAVRNRAQSEGRAFTVTEPLPIPPDCEICEVVLVPGIGTGHGGNDDSPSYDCVEPDLEYIDGNVRVICWGCNSVKGDGSAAEHLIVADGIDDFYANPPTLDEGPPTREERKSFIDKAWSAKNRGKTFTLSAPLWHPPSCYCGRAIFKGENWFAYNSPSHDCVDPKLQYVDGNVRIICNRCNSVKKDGDAKLHRQIAAYMIRLRGLPRTGAASR